MLASFFVNVGCSFGMSPYSKKGHIRALSDSEFIFYFNRDDVYRKGMDEPTAAGLYMMEHSLIPSECASDITILYVGAGQNGSGFARFVCKKEVVK